MIVNLTPHVINLVTGPLERGGRIPRVEEKLKFIETYEGIPVYEITYGAVTDAPPLRPDTIYVVSRMVADALPGRTDLVFPIMLERDGKGVVIAAKGFGRVG